MIGKRVSHYKILRQLGGGGMGVVYEAEDLVLQRPVALKFLPDPLARDPKALERFQREARAASSLNHPHICTVHELGEEAGRQFLVMELMEGQTLKYLIEKEPMPVEQVARIGAQVAEALEAAHAAGIVHRDIKPANVFVTSRGDAKVLDFGLAMVAQRPAQAGSDSTLTDSSVQTALAPDPLTRPGAMLGTIAYMSPEQVRGEELDERTDLFSLGVLLYEMATGAHPFGGQTSGVVFNRILSASPRDASAVNPRIPHELAGVLDKALEKDASLRYQSARELRVDLERLTRQSDSGSSVAAARPARRPAGAGARRPLWLVLGAVALALVAAGIWRAREASAPGARPAPAARSGAPSIAVIPLVDQSRDRDNEYFSDGLSEELINVLSHIPGLEVVGSTSSFQFKGTDEDARVIGERLGVASILEGSVRKAGADLRITVRLVDAASGFELWSSRYDRELDDIFAVQDDIARSVAAALEVRLLGQEGLELTPRGADGAAYNLVLQGKFLSDRRSREDLEQAASYFDQALAIDPGYALAWARLGEVRVRQASFGFLSFAEGFDAARDAAAKALELDDTLAEAWALRARIKSGYDWDWAEADRSSRRALELAPGDVHILASLALVPRAVGDVDESIRRSRRAVELDPLGVGNYQALTSNLYFAGRLEEAETVGHKVLELEPGRTASHYRLGLIYLELGKPGEALAEFEREAIDGFRLQGMALANFALGRRGPADAALDKLVEDYGEAAAFQIAEVHAFRDEPDEAFEWLERAYRQRDTGLADSAISPLFVNLHADPRWAAFLGKMGLPTELRPPTS